MFNPQILRQFSRLSISAATKLPLNSRHFGGSAILQFKITDQLWAEPLKKKKKVDPAIIKAREDRRRKKIEKQIRKLEKNARQLKPLEEIEPPLHLLDQMGYMDDIKKVAGSCWCQAARYCGVWQSLREAYGLCPALDVHQLERRQQYINKIVRKRKRPAVVLSAEETEYRALLLKEWSRYKKQEYMANVAQIDRIMAAQRRALDMLYEESEELYNEAIMPDLQLVPCSFSGTYSTPPIKNYDSPDGEYIDVSKKWGHK